jgi:hypothetical protein
VRDGKDDELVGVDHVDDEERMPSDLCAPHFVGAIEAGPDWRRDGKPAKPEHETRDLLFQS